MHLNPPCICMITCRCGGAAKVRQDASADVVIQVLQRDVDNG